MSAHVTALCRSGLFPLRQLRPFVQSLTMEAAKTLVQAFMCCHLDYCNSLLYGVTDSVMRRVHLLQNAAARLIPGARCWHHIMSASLDSSLALSRVQTLLFGAPGIVRSNAYLPGWWCPSCLWRQLTVSLTVFFDNVCSSMYAQQRQREAFELRWANLEQSATWPANTLHQLQTFWNTTEDIYVWLGHGTLWHLSIITVEILLLNTYLLTPLHRPSNTKPDYWDCKL